VTGVTPHGVVRGDFTSSTSCLHGPLHTLPRRRAIHRIPHLFHRLLFAAAAAFASSLLLASCVPSTEGAARPMHPALRALPTRIAWAWERPEDLRWLPRDAGVAYVHSSIFIAGDDAKTRLRANPLRVRPDTVLVPVVHVDASVRDAPALNSAQRDAVVQQLLEAASFSNAKVVQLDFEVRRSQRDFLRSVVRAARLALPTDVALSITALASWCHGDAWMHPMPADEIVPMAFRMSRDSETLRAYLRRHGAFKRQARDGCGAAIGSATDEPLAGLAAPRHYVFSPTPWTEAAWLAHPFDPAPR
jgi:hypothetical protein